MNDNSKTFADVAEVLLNPATRAAVRANPRQYAIDTGMIAADSSVEVKLVVCGSGKMLLPIQTVGAHGVLDSTQLREISGGSTAGSVGSATTASTVGCAVSCFSSAGSLSTAASVGSAACSGES